MQLHRWLKSLGNTDLKIRHGPASSARIPERAGANARGTSYAQPERVIALSQVLELRDGRTGRPSKAVPPEQGQSLLLMPLHRAGGASLSTGVGSESP